MPRPVSVRVPTSHTKSPSLKDLEEDRHTLDGIDRSRLPPRRLVKGLTPAPGRERTLPGPTPTGGAPPLSDPFSTSPHSPSLCVSVCVCQ